MNKWRVSEHWQLNPGAPGLIPGDYQFLLSTYPPHWPHSQATFHFPTSLAPFPGYFPLSHLIGPIPRLLSTSPPHWPHSQATFHFPTSLAPFPGYFPLTHLIGPIPRLFPFVRAQGKTLVSSLDPTLSRGETVW